MVLWAPNSQAVLPLRPACHRNDTNQILPNLLMICHCDCGEAQIEKVKNMGWAGPFMRGPAPFSFKIPCEKRPSASHIPVPTLGELESCVRFLSYQSFPLDLTRSLVR